MCSIQHTSYFQHYNRTLVRVAISYSSPLPPFSSNSQAPWANSRSEAWTHSWNLTSTCQIYLGIFTLLFKAKSGSKAQDCISDIAGFCQWHGPTDIVQSAIFARRMVFLNVENSFLKISALGHTSLSDYTHQEKKQVSFPPPPEDSLASLGCSRHDKRIMTFSALFLLPHLKTSN